MLSSECEYWTNLFHLKASNLSFPCNLYSHVCEFHGAIFSHIAELDYLLFSDTKVEPASVRELKERKVREKKLCNLRWRPLSMSYLRAIRLLDSLNFCMATLVARTFIPWLTNWLICTPTDWLTYCPTDLLTPRWLTDLLTHRLIATLALVVLVLILFI